MTLTRRLVLGFSLLAVMLLVLPGALIGTALQGYFREQASRETLDIVSYMQRRIVSIYKQLTPAEIASGELMRRLDRSMQDYLVLGEGLQLESVFFVQMRHLSTNVTIRTPNLEGRDISIDEPNSLFLGNMQTHTHGVIPVLYYRTQLDHEGKPFSDLQVAVSMGEYNAILRQLLIFWVIGSLIALTLTIIVGWLLARQILKPLASLTFEIEGMMQSETLGQLDTRELPPDQIRRLAQTFNTLLAQMAETFERQQRFVSDASHELRSPLTAIQGHAELLLKRGQSNPEILTEGLGIISRESNRLGKLVEDLLLLAQTRHRKPRSERFNLASVARQVVESRLLLHGNLSYSGSSSALMSGDQNAIRRIVLNLIDNALRFTPPEAPIEVKVYQRDGSCWLVVRDHGAGIPAANLPHIFERFYRIEADRNRQQGGAGLGLPIVKELVEWHQGHIEVSSSESEGTTFTIRFPALSSSE